VYTRETSDLPKLLCNWNGNICRDRGWFKGGSKWDSLNGYYDASSNCVIDAINAVYSGVQYDAYVGAVYYWIGYH
jgi:hypothetical protein